MAVARKPEGATRGPVSLSYQDLDVPAARWGATIAEMRADLAAGKPVDLYRLFHLLESCAKQQGCTAAPAEELDRRFELLDRAAAAGDLRAQVQFARHVPDELRGEENLFRHPEKVVEWKAKRAAYLEAAAERGSHDAFLTLASIHREERPGGDSGVTALAYYLAWAETQPRGAATQQSREFYGQGLTPDQVRQAETLRDQMLARCCR